MIDQRLSRTSSARCKRQRDRERLKRAENDGQVARVLRDLAAAELAFLLQALEIGPDDHQQLQNDRRRDVRHDAERENRQPAKIAAAEKIDNAEHRALILLEELLERIGVDSGRGNESAEAIHRQQGQRKQHAIAQVGRAEDVPKGFEQLSHFRTSIFPPALRDLFLRRLAEGMRANRQCNLQFAITENLHAVAHGANDAARR